MWHLLVSVCLVIFSSPLTSASEPHYAITIPRKLVEGTEQKVCVTFLNLKGTADIKIELKTDDQVHIITEHKVNSRHHSDCYAFQVPIIKGEELISQLHVSAHGEHINVEESNKVAIVKTKDVCIIQTDRSFYIPGDVVKFHVVTLNRDSQAISKKYPLIELIDGTRIRIAQWLNVTTEQGFAEFSFHLANELVFGEYTINIPDNCEKTFKVEKYEKKRFEFNLNIPSDIYLRDKSFHLDACGSYTYGKPVEGKIDLSVCTEEDHQKFWYERPSSEEADKKKCIDIKGEKTDNKGCISRDIKLGNFYLSTTKLYQYLKINSELTEDGTGHSEKVSTEVYLKLAIKVAEFVEWERIYYRGFPYHGKVKLLNEKKQPVVNKAIIIDVEHDESNNPEAHVHLVTDLNGTAEFTLNTSEWQADIYLQARLSSDAHEDDDDDDTKYYGLQQTRVWLQPFYSNSESLLSVQKHSLEVSCNSEQSVVVEYDIHKKNLDSDADHLHFFYILVTKNGIFSYKENIVDIKDQANSPNLHGSFPLNFHVDGNFFPTFSLVVFSVLPNGEIIAWATNYDVSSCVQNKVKLSFSEEQVRPGENVNLEVTADAGSVCSVRSVDKGYLLGKPFDDNYLQTDVTREMWNTIRSFKYDYRVQEDPDIYQCPENMRGEINSKDVSQLFQENSLKIFTNAQIKAPVKCVSNDIFARSSTKRKLTERKDTDKKFLKRSTRSYFPDTWLYELVPVGLEGHSVLNRTTPHTITKWVTNAFCLSKAGFAEVKNVELIAFQPYFIDLIVPYSVIQGEKFTIQAMVFSYAKKCILIAVSLSDSEDLRTVNDKEQTRCVCEGHSHTFSWDVSALQTKSLKIHIDSGSIEVDKGCTQDILIGKDGMKDSVEKTVLVKPKGYEDEQTKTFILFQSDHREAIAINLSVPERLVPGSERAHLIILGDLMANSVANLENLFDMPEGCGEQNIAKFSRYVSALEYLESIEELTPELKAKMIESLVQGYQRQLTYRTENGFNTFFVGDLENIWLTAVVVRAFAAAQKFIYINEKHIQQPLNLLHSKQLPDGCFRYPNYYYFVNEKINEVMHTAYITIALLENHVVHNGSIVEDALSCLRKSADKVTSVYTLALLAYAFTLSGDSELRAQMMKKLDEKAVKEEGLKHWETDSGEIEIASYVALALLSEKTTSVKNLEDCEDIIQWIFTQQNPWGGFSSSQDTTLALKVLAKYGNAISHRKGDATVTIESKSGFQKTVHVDKSNSLLVQRVDLPEIPGEYTVSVTGGGFIYLQSHLHCNVLPEQSKNGYFSFRVTTEPSACTHASHKHFDVRMDVRYTGERESTNMAIIVVDTVSGYVPDKENEEKLKKHPLVKRTEISAQNIVIYLSKLTRETVHLVFSLEQEALVENLQPVNAVVLDYYDPDEHKVVQYSAPCSSGFKTDEH